MEENRIKLIIKINFRDCDWFKKLLFSTNSCQIVIGQFVIGQFNKPTTFKVVV